jgi:cell division septal protein FtsQ
MFGKKQKQFHRNKKIDVPLKSQEFLDRENKRRSSLFLQVLYYFLLVAFVGVSAYALFFSQFLQITNVNVQGANELSSGDITQLVRDQLLGKYLKAIPKNNFILFSDRKAENVIKDQFKKVASVSIAKKFPDTLNVSIMERQSLLVWCSNEACFLIDESGIAYATADFNSPEVTENHLVKITDTGGKAVAIGDNVLGGDFLKYVSQVSSALKNETQIDITDEYSTPAAVSQEVGVATPGGMRLMFSMSYPLEEAVKNLKLFLTKQNFPQPLEDQLEYIDLRSENKIFYKLKNPPTDGSDQAGSTDTSSQKSSSSDDKKGKDDKKK